MFGLFTLQLSLLAFFKYYKIYQSWSLPIFYNITYVYMNEIRVFVKLNILPIKCHVFDTSFSDEIMCHY